VSKILAGRPLLDQAPGIEHADPLADPDERPRARLTVESEVLDLTRALRREFSTSIRSSATISRSSRICERVGVLYAGRLIEEGPTGQIFDTPRHPYTVGLLRCLPRGGRVKADGPLDTIPASRLAGYRAAGCTFAERCALADDGCRAAEPSLTDLGGRQTRCFHHDQAPNMPSAVAAEFDAASPPPADAPPILTATGLSKTFNFGGHRLAALRDISFSLRSGETLGLVGESGSGKTTLAARCSA